MKKHRQLQRDSTAQKKKISSTSNKVVVYVDNKYMHILNKKSDKNEKLNGMNTVKKQWNCFLEKKVSLSKDKPVKFTFANFVYLH